MSLLNKYVDDAQTLEHVLNCADYLGKCITYLLMSINSIFSYSANDGLFDGSAGHRKSTTARDCSAHTTEHSQPRHALAVVLDEAGLRASLVLRTWWHSSVCQIDQNSGERRQSSLAAHQLHCHTHVGLFRYVSALRSISKLTVGPTENSDADLQAADLVPQMIENLRVDDGTRLAEVSAKLLYSLAKFGKSSKMTCFMTRVTQSKLPLCRCRKNRQAWRR